MRILEAFGEPISNGGQESFVRSLISHMDRAGLTVDLLTPYYCDNDRYREVTASWGGTLTELHETFNPGGSRFGIVKPLTAYLKDHSYDVVHVHSGSISILVIFAVCARRAGVKKILVHSHCAIEGFSLKNVILKTLGSLVLHKNADVFCACSEVAAKAKFVPWLLGKPVRIFKNGVDLKRFAFQPDFRSALRNNLGIPEDALVVGHVGRFSYQKNHEYLIRVFDQLQKERGGTAHLLLIGAGETEPAVREQVANLGLQESVHFLGTLDNVQDYLSAMDVFVLPSRYEGLPLVGVEAEAAGLPVVTSTGVSRELDLCDGVRFLPLSEDVSDWVRTIQELTGTRNDHSAEQLNAAGYNIDLTAAEVREVYLDS